jgi:hypothetical protein
MDNHMTPARLAEIQARVDALLKLEEDAYLYHIDGNVLGMSLYDFEQTMVAAAQSMTDLLASLRTAYQREETLLGETQASHDREDALSAEVARLTASLATVTRERDAAVKDLLYVANGGSHCDVCAHDDDGFQFTPPHCKYIGRSQRCFMWRGPCEENAPEVSE